MPRSAHISFRAHTPVLAARLATAGAPTAQRDLERYYQSLDTALREVSLTEPEWNYLRDILRGTFIDTNTARLLWAEVEDAEDEYGAKWGVDPTDLSGRLRTLSPFQCLAIADAIERWWAAQR